MTKTVRFIGLDVHKDTIAVAVADETSPREARFRGTIANAPEAILPATRRQGRDHPGRGAKFQ